MITWLSEKMAGLFVGSGAANEEDRDVYVYGMDVLLSTALSILCILAIGILIGKGIETLLYILLFTVLRSAAGGFHANTHWGCFLIMLGSYGIMLALLTFLPLEACRWAALPLAVASLAVVAVLAPAPHENRPVSAKELKRFRRLSLWLAFAEVLAVLLCLLCAAASLALAAALGMVTSALSLVAVSISRKLKRKVNTFENA